MPEGFFCRDNFAFLFCFRMGISDARDKASCIQNAGFYKLARYRLLKNNPDTLLKCQECHGSVLQMGIHQTVGNIRKKNNTVLQTHQPNLKAKNHQQIVRQYASRSQDKIALTRHSNADIDYQCDCQYLQHRGTP